MDKVKLDNIFIFSRTILRDKAWLSWIELLANYKPSLLYSNIHTDFKELEKMINNWDT